MAPAAVTAWPGTAVTAGTGGGIGGVEPGVGGGAPGGTAPIARAVIEAGRGTARTDGAGC
ncbi:MAG: hypothetical protein ACLQMH_18485 [Solirubrobacteraceae bacterium]